MRIIAQWTISKEYVVEYFEERSVLKEKNYSAFIFLGGVVLGCSVVYFSKYLLNINIGYFVAILLAWFIVFVYLIWLRARRTCEAIETFGENFSVEAHFTEEGFSLSHQDAESQCQWKFLNKVVLSKKGIFLELPGCQHIYVPDSSIVCGGDKSNILELFFNADRLSTSRGKA